MMRIQHWQTTLALLLCAGLLAGCASHENWKPDSRITGLQYRPDDSTLVVQVRLRNPSDHAQIVAGVEAELWLTGQRVVKTQQSLNLDIPAGGVEIVEFETPPVETAVRWLIEHRQPLPYRLATSVRREAGGRALSSESEGQLDPTPGIPNQYR